MSRSLNCWAIFSSLISDAKGLVYCWITLRLKETTGIFGSTKLSAAGETDLEKMSEQKKKIFSGWVKSRPTKRFPGMPNPNPNRRSRSQFRFNRVFRISNPDIIPNKRQMKFFGVAGVLLLHQSFKPDTDRGGEAFGLLTQLSWVWYPAFQRINLSILLQDKN